MVRKQPGIETREAEFAGYLQMFSFVIVSPSGFNFLCQNSRKSSPCIDRTPSFAGVSHSGGPQPRNPLSRRHSVFCIVKE